MVTSDAPYIHIVIAFFAFKSDPVSWLSVQKFTRTSKRVAYAPKDSFMNVFVTKLHL